MGGEQVGTDPVESGRGRFDELFVPVGRHFPESRGGFAFCVGVGFGVEHRLGDRSRGQWPVVVDGVEEQFIAGDVPSQ